MTEVGDTGTIGYEVLTTCPDHAARCELCSTGPSVASWADFIAQLEDGRTVYACEECLDD